MKQYCCKSFEIWNDPRNGSSPNIRILKVKPVNKNHAFYVPPKTRDEVKLENSSYRFLITLGYKGGFHLNMPMINISYCPFCGRNLFDFYNNDVFVNEEQGITFDKP